MKFEFPLEVQRRFLFFPRRQVTRKHTRTAHGLGERGAHARNTGSSEEKNWAPCQKYDEVTARIRHVLGILGSQLVGSREIKQKTKATRPATGHLPWASYCACHSSGGYIPCHNPRAMADWGGVSFPHSATCRLTSNAPQVSLSSIILLS